MGEESMIVPDPEIVQEKDLKEQKSKLQKLSGQKLMDVAKPRIKLIIKKASMGEERMIVPDPEIVQGKDLDVPELNEQKRKMEKLSGQKLMDVAKPRIRLIIKKASMGEERIIVPDPKTVQGKDLDVPELNEQKRKLQKLSGQKLMDVAKPRIKLIKKASMGEERMIVPVHEIVQRKGLDVPGLNEQKRRQQKLSGQKRRGSKPGGKSKDILEMWELISSDQNQQICYDNAMVKKVLQEDAEIELMFDRVKRRKKNEKSSQEIALLVEKVMALLEVAGEEDAQLNEQEKPAIRKIQMLPLLTDFLSKKKFQAEFLDHGVLTLLKNWLEPLPDGSLPNVTVRASILKILTQVLPIDIEQVDRREQLKKSGLGKVVMFLSKSDEEITANKKLAKDLIETWSRTIFNKSTRFSDLRNIEENDVPFMKPSMKKPVNQASLTVQFREADLDLDLSVTREPKPSHQSCSSSCQRASRPEATTSVYMVRPQSNFNPDIARQVVRGKRRGRIEKNLKQLKASNKKPMQAAKVSARGRGIFTYL
ncbi:hypothetical protein CRYUN_Cryun41cG0065400 [Craigia yunnanensis]